MQRENTNLSPKVTLPSSTTSSLATRGATSPACASSPRRNIPPSHAQPPSSVSTTPSPRPHTVVPLTEYEKAQPRTDGSAITEARNEALIERAKDNPGKFTIIQSKIANGRGLQLVLTVVTGGFWKDGPDAWEEDMEGEDRMEEVEGEENEFSGRRVDEVDFMMARMALTGFLETMGHAPAF